MRKNAFFFSLLDAHYKQIIIVLRIFFFSTPYHSFFRLRTQREKQKKIYIKFSSHINRFCSFVRLFSFCQINSFDSRSFAIKLKFFFFCSLYFQLFFFLRICVLFFSHYLPPIRPLCEMSDPLLFSCILFLFMFLYYFFFLPKPKNFDTFYN